MKISEMIEYLQTIQSQHGDLTVVFDPHDEDLWEIEGIVIKRAYMYDTIMLPTNDGDVRVNTFPVCVLE